ncbi:MAG: glycosyltransferase [Flavitalea sp.]
MYFTSPTKPVILIFPFGLLSHYLRCLVLCRQFTREFNVRIAYHPAFASFITEEGIGTFYCDSIDAGPAVDAVKEFDFSWINEPTLRKLYKEQVRAIKKYKPAAVLGDNCPTLKMAAETTSVLFISLLNGYMSKSYAGLRKISKTHPAFHLVKLLSPTLQTLVTRKGESYAFRQIHKPFRKIRQQFQLERCSNYLDELEGDINLICDLEVLFPQKEVSTSLHVIGPLFYDSPSRKTSTTLNRNESKKTIFVSMGSSGDWQNVHFLNDPYFERYNVIVAGDKQKILSADHIVHTPFIDVQQEFPLIELVICHGGNGTIYQALLYEIPVLCKTSHCEQEWNAHAVEENMLGKCLDDTSDFELYKKIIGEWILEKGNDNFKKWSTKIRTGIFKLPGVIKTISDQLLTENAKIIMGQKFFDNASVELNRKK